MRRLAATVCVALAAATAVGCRGPQRDVTFSTTSPTDAPAANATSIESRLIKTVPAGYDREADNVGDTGPSDLAKAIRDDGNPDAERVLKGDGFVGGYQRLWTKGANQLVDFVYDFTTPVGAQHYAARLVRAAAQGGESTTVTEFAVTGIAGARGFAAHAADSDAVVVVFTRDTYVAQIVVNGTDASPALANSLAAQQNGLLGTGRS